MWTHILMLPKLILFGTSVLLQLVLLFSISPLCLVNYEIILKWKLVSTPTLLHSHQRDHALLHDLMWNGVETRASLGVYLRIRAGLARSYGAQVPMHTGGALAHAGLPVRCAYISSTELQPSIHVSSSFSHPQQCRRAQYSPSLHPHYSAQPPALLAHTSSPTHSHMHSVAPCESPASAHSPYLSLRTLQSLRTTSGCPCLLALLSTATHALPHLLACSSTHSAARQGPALPRGSQDLSNVIRDSIWCVPLHVSVLRLPSPVCCLSWACSCPLCIRACTHFLIWKDAITIGPLFAPYSFLRLSLLLYVLEVPGSTLPLPI